MKVRPSILLFNQEHDKVLLMKYQYGGTDVFGIPGGNPGKGETLIRTLERELQEELSVQIQVKQLVCVGEVLNKEKTDYALHCIFTGEIVSGVPQVNPEHTSSIGIIWTSIQELHGIVTYPDLTPILDTLATREQQTNPYIGLIPKEWF